MSKTKPQTTSYKLTYFDGKGRAEVARLMFNYYGQKFEDERITFDQWGARKAGTPQGTLPFLTIDGKTTVGQSHAINRLLAKEFGYYGKTNLEAAEIDVIVETMRDFMDLVMKAMFADDATKETLMKKLKEEDSPKSFALLEKAIGGNGFAFGSSVTLADFVVFGGLDFAKALVQVDDKYSKLNKLTTRFEKDPKISKYLKERPVTKF